MQGLSRRGLIGGAAAGVALAATADAAAKEAAAARFGPPAGKAHLVYNENPYGPAPSAIRAMADAARGGCYYQWETEQRLTAMIAERCKVSPKQVVLGNGSFEVLAAAATEWGSAAPILCPELLFDEPIGHAEALGAKRVTVPLAADMGVDLAALAAAAEGAGVVYLCNPNNPTGMLIDPARLRAFTREVSARTPVLVDEAYNELTGQPETASMLDLVREGREVIIARTFSKIYGMAGLRVGYAIASEANAERIRKRLGTIGVNSAGLAAAIACYNDTAFTRFSLDRVREARALILDAVSKAGLRALPSETNFVFVEVPDANALRDAMARRDIAIRGAYGRWTRWSRVSTGRIKDVRRYAQALPQLARA